MKHPFLALLAAAAFSLSVQAQTSPKGPTMGWSSWNTYLTNINETLIKKQATAMVSKGFKNAGYQYINIDDGFQGGRDSGTGQLLINKSRFPNGLKPVVDFIHNKGLKAGIYSDAGHNTCGSYHNGDALGKNTGLYQHDEQDAEYFFNELGFDFIKVDFCGGDPIHNEDQLKLDEEERYSAIWQAILSTGRTDVRYNVCRWAYPGTWIHDVSTSWRTTGDINASWNSVKGIIDENLYLSAYCFDGHYNDMDMLEVGRGLTVEEDKTHFGMWCIMASPLLIGCDMSALTVSGRVTKLLSNPDLIALNQDSLYLQAYVAKRSGNCYVLVKDIAQRFGTRRAVALYNASDADKDITLNFADVELAGRVKMHDCFEQTDIDDAETSFTVNVPAHGTRIYTLEAEQRLERTLYEAETAYLSRYQEIKNNQSYVSGVYTSDNACSGGMKAGWLGDRSDNDLQWRHVYSQGGGEYTLELAYECGENRSLTLEVNGQKVGTYSLNSGSYSSVAKKKVAVTLNDGENVVRLYNTSGWMPDIDYMRLTLVSRPASVVAPQRPAAAASETYTISGRRADAHTKGLVIENGKKVRR